MVSQFRTCYNILKIDVIAITSCAATRNDTVRLILADHLYGLDGCIDGSYTALLQDQLVFGKQRTELLVLFVHRYNHTYFHLILHNGIKCLIFAVPLPYSLIHENSR